MNERKVKGNLKLYALVVLSGQDGPFHSIDHPKVWGTKAAAKRYKIESVPKAKQALYQIVEFVARRGEKGGVERC